MCVEQGVQLVTRAGRRRVEVSAPVLFFIFGRVEVFCTCVTACQTMKDERYLNFSAIAHSDKQISLRISSIVFSNASVGTLLIKLGDNALYVLFGSYIKTEEITASRSMLFSNAVAFNLIKLQ